MPQTCSEIYFQELANCDLAYQQAVVACSGDPDCLKLAVDTRQACEDRAYLKYLQCIGQQGSGS